MVHLAEKSPAIQQCGLCNKADTFRFGPISRNTPCSPKPGRVVASRRSSLDGNAVAGRHVLGLWTTGSVTDQAMGDYLDRPGGLGRSGFSEKSGGTDNWDWDVNMGIVSLLYLKMPRIHIHEPLRRHVARSYSLTDNMHAEHLYDYLQTCATLGRCFANRRPKCPAGCSDNLPIDPPPASPRHLVFSLSLPLSQVIQTKPKMFSRQAVRTTSMLAQRGFASTARAERSVAVLGAAGEF